MSKRGNTGFKVILAIVFIIGWVLILSVFIESEGEKLTNAEWLVGSVVSFAMLAGYFYAIVALDRNSSEG